MEVQTIAVVGSGVMGQGIAYAAAVGGFQVALHDVKQEALERARQAIERDLQEGVKRGKLSQADAEAALGRIRLSDTLAEAARDADLVIEAVLELMDLKVEIFRQLDKICKPHAILATNTSTMSPTEIAAGTGRPDRCVAMHFFNPVPKMKLVEIIRGMDTSDQTVRIVRAAAGQMGKETVEVNEFPGFVPGRISALVGNEAMYMLMEGVASAEDIDKAIRLGLGYPMGPLELADLVGLDSRLRNLEYLHKTLGEKYRPCPLLIKYVKAGRLGKKSGRGIFEYGEDGKRISPTDRN
ncbi:3-hydroxyacyl-CoA dehydrogenase [Effusibacillus lacus]|uniref:3-hydroxybutyryl-CoA dehydrogenase n=1 Tax=Effusibacillus lacus TaxID=1348429 RepID=A0A292YMN7_9BACL|nr:3-hydroxyacyl-CoA dehydrogenase [Effusibacillus lacus]TCS71654.1 3-hydroxyacyl-CoA dehydrogenase [Effusibacillus lacus]GAX90159.1 3-hydroxybutyryl-CoA dehydrogenase [Effusibacillus lacus]